MSQVNQDKLNRLLKYIPWLVLILLLVVTFNLWPRTSRTAAKHKQDNKESTATTAPKPQPKNQPAGSEGQVLSEVLNFRAKPSLSGRTVITTLTRGTKVKVVENQGKWLKVQLDDGRVGYITSNPKYVRITKAGQ